MSRPTIVVSSVRERLPTGFGDLDCTRLISEYTDILYCVGAQPVILPVTDRPPSELLANTDALVLTGGGDINPALYDQDEDPSVYGIRSDRDTFEAALYHNAIALGLPIFAICRGMQLVNVLRGGTLVQHVEGHWQPADPAKPFHRVEIEAGSLLSAATGEAAEFAVNSYHHQSLGELGHGLKVTARCGEVVEAVESRDADLIAVQWHPELMASTDRLQRALFEDFVQRAANR